jgi:hypothetical protein
MQSQQLDVDLLVGYKKKKKTAQMLEMVKHPVPKDMGL